MDKLGKLKNILRKMGSVVVAYSGGVDSSLLLAAAKDALKDKTLAVTAVSATYTPQELIRAKRIAAGLKVRHRVVRTREFSDRRFAANPIDRCYYCKRELFGRLRNIAAREKYNFVVDAATISDKTDFRPGAKAAKEFGVRSPLQEAGLTKTDVRRYSRRRGLDTWNMPSQACLASRIPYGTRITPEVLARVRKAESFLNTLKLGQLRLRHYQGLCRIEVEKKMIPKVIAQREKIARRLKRLGYRYITLDLEGYRTGSMNSEVKSWKKYI